MQLLEPPSLSAANHDVHPGSIQPHPTRGNSPPRIAHLHRDTHLLDKRHWRVLSRVAAEARTRTQVATWVHHKSLWPPDAQVAT